MKRFTKGINDLLKLILNCNAALISIPEYRYKGVGKAVILEALKRAFSLGAKKAYVISDSYFYKSLGFHNHSYYTFYWHNI